MAFDSLYIANSPDHAHDILKAEDELKSGRIKNARAFNLHFYLTEDELISVLKRNKKKIRCFGYCYHDKDIGDEGPVKPHFHLVIRTFSAFTRFQVYKWFQPFLWDFTDGKWLKKENISIEFTRDLTASVEYLTHENDPEKYHYDRSLIISDDFDDLSHVSDKSKDDSFEIIMAIVDGMSEVDLLRRYGREYIYHKKQYRDCALALIYEENQQLLLTDKDRTVNLYRETTARKLHEISTILSGKDYYFTDYE